MFSFTLFKCLKENIAVDKEKKNTIYAIHYMALQHMVQVQHRVCEETI